MCPVLTTDHQAVFCNQVHGAVFSASCWLLAAVFSAGCWLLAAGCWLLAAGCWLMYAVLVAGLSQTTVG